MSGREPAGTGRREDKRIQEHDHDPYKAHAKPSEPSVCGTCGAVFHAGRWSWQPRPDGAEEVTCPACRRIADAYPAGFVELSGRFLRERRAEVEATVRHAAEAETREHPQNRLMELNWRHGRLKALTTDLHSARRIGEAVRHAYGGELELDYAPSETQLRVTWSRES